MINYSHSLVQQQRGLLLLMACLMVYAKAQNHHRSLFSPNAPGRCDQDTFTFLGDCYSVDRLLCEFRNSDGCVEIFGTFDYYNSYEGTYEDYVTVDIEASYDCATTSHDKKNSCKIEINGQSCEACSISEHGEKVITLESCQNLPGVFPQYTQEITLSRTRESYLKLEYSEARCLHPAVPSSLCSRRSSTEQVGSNSCYTVNREVCSYEHLDSGCIEFVGTYDYYYGQHKNDLLTVRVQASSGCQETRGYDDCWIQAQDSYCRTCSFDGDTKMISFSDCGNIPGMFASGDQSIFLGNSEDLFRLEPPGEGGDTCEQPAGAAVPIEAKEVVHDETVNLRDFASTVNVAVKEHYVFDFFPNRVLVEPDSQSVAILTERTAEFFRDLYRSKYGDSFDSFQMGDIQTHYSPSDHRFNFDFEANIQFTSSSVVSNKTVARLISQSQTLNDYVGAIRYSKRGQPNGPFLHTSSVRARVTGSEHV